MTAEWKKKPLERGKRYSDIQRLQARVKVLEGTLEAHKADNRWLRGLYEQARESMSELRGGHAAYMALRERGVLLEDGGEFKYLQGEDLDKFLNTLYNASTYTFSGGSIRGNMIRNPSVTIYQTPKSAQSLANMVQIAPGTWEQAVDEKLFEAFLNGSNP